MKILFIGSTSACFELDNDMPYYAPCDHMVYLDGVEYLSGDTNVFSVFDLTPDKEYAVDVRFSSGMEESISFTTKKETCCINVKDLGAAGDGITEDTVAIQRGIMLLPKGGRLYFPEGTYLTLPLTLKSDIILELSENAVLLGSNDRSCYPIIPAAITDEVTGEDIPLASFEGNEVDCYQSLLYCSYSDNIIITGKGKIDGNAQNGDWWGDFKSFPAARPMIFFCNRCSNVTIHGVSVTNSPAWNLHPFFSEHVSILDCNVTAPKDSPNTDAVDPESCTDVMIMGCNFSVGDDCVAIKSGKLEMGRKYRTPAGHTVIRNCLMQYGHGAVTLGSELAGGVNDLSVTQCYFKATDRGLRIKTRRGRGKDCKITNVEFSNIRMDRVLTPFVINMWYNCVDPDCESEYVWSRKTLPVDERTPHLGSFTFNNIKCTDAEVAASYIDGLPESPVEEVAFENVEISFAEDARPGIPAMKSFAEECCHMGFYFDNVGKVTLKNVRLEGEDGDKVIAQHVREMNGSVD